MGFSSLPIVTNHLSIKNDLCFSVAKCSIINVYCTLCHEDRSVDKGA